MAGNRKKHTKAVAQEKIIKKHREQLHLDIKRGFLFFTILNLISQKPKYAYQIKDEIYTITGGVLDIDRNNLYKRLRAMQRDGILQCFTKPSPHGANRKYYRLTPFGKHLLDDLSRLIIPVMDSFLKGVKTSFKSIARQQDK